MTPHCPFCCKIHRKTHGVCQILHKTHEYIIHNTDPLKVVPPSAFCGEATCGISIDVYRYEVQYRCPVHKEIWANKTNACAHTNSTFKFTACVMFLYYYDHYILTTFLTLTKYFLRLPREKNLRQNLQLQN